MQYILNELIAVIMPLVYVAMAHPTVSIPIAVVAPFVLGALKK